VRAVLLRLAVTRLPQLRERRLHLRVLHLRRVVVRVAPAPTTHATVVRQTLNSYIENKHSYFGLHRLNINFIY
jgi:hypothetical protein